MSDEDDKAKAAKQPLQEMCDDIDRELLVTTSREYRFMLLQMARLASHFQSEQGTLIRAMERIERHKLLLFGDDMKGIPGLKEQVADVVKERKEALWLRRVIAAAIIGHLVVYLAMKLLK